MGGGERVRDRGRERERDTERIRMNEGAKEKREYEREGGRGKAKRTPPRPMNAGIVPSFLNLIYHIITPRKKKTSISRRNGDVSMENLRILVHNRSGVKKNQRDQRQSSLEYRCVSELKIDDADYKVLFSSLFSPLFPFQGRN